jgi:hypothetical protein
MTTLAGQMTQSPSGNAEWILCDGRYIFVNEIPPGLPRTPVSTTAGTGYRLDYLLRNGGWSGRRGIGRWRIRIPYDPTGTWYIKTCDDLPDASLTNPPTPQNPPAGVT